MPRLLVDIFVGDLPDSHRFVIVGYDKALCLQHLYGGPDRTAAHAQFAGKHRFRERHTWGICEIQYLFLYLLVSLVGERCIFFSHAGSFLRL